MTTWRSYLPVVCGISLLKAVQLGLVVAGAQWFPDSFRLDNLRLNFPAQAQAPVTVWSHFATWDAQHYLQLAEFGYRAGHREDVFYPLWPLLMRWFAPCCGGNLVLAGLLLANALSLAAGVLLFRLLRRQRGERVAYFGVAMAFCWPGAFYLALPFTEGLFMLLAVLFFEFVDQRRWFPLAACCLLLPLCRPVGILMLVPLTALSVSAYGAGGPRSLWPYLGAMAATVAGVVLYLLDQWASTGNPFEGSHMQIHFIAHASASGLWRLDRFLADLVTGGPGIPRSALDRCSFLLFAGYCVVLWRTDRLGFWFGLPVGLVPALTVRLMSYLRYFAADLPVSMAAGQQLAAQRPLVGLGALLLSLLLQLELLWQHSNHLWVA